MKDCFNNGKNSTISITNNSNDIDTSEFNTVEDFQKFIDENGITRPVDFKRFYGRLYNKLVKSKLAGKVKYINRVNIKFTHLNSLEDFQEFIDENDIQNPSEFHNKFSAGYVRLCNLGFSDKVTYPNKRIPINYSVEELQEIIDSNNIRTAKEFKQKFKSIYGYANSNGLGKFLKYPDAPKDCSFIKDLETAQDFVDENNIQNYTDFIERFPNEYHRLGYLKLKGKIKYSNPLQHNYGDTFSTLEEIQEFIDSHPEITSPKVFERLYPSLHHRSRTIGVRKLLKFPNRTIEWGDKYKTPEEMQKFIDENNVLSPTDLRIRFPKEYHKANNERYISQLYFPEKQESNVESKIRRLLDELGIEYIPKCHTFDWLIYKRRLELDFFIYPHLILV